MASSLSFVAADQSIPVAELTVGELLREAARDNPDRICLIYSSAPDAAEQRWTYAEVLAEAERVARILMAEFSAGDRIAVWSPNCPQWLFLQFGAALAGLTLVTVNPAYLAREVGHVLGQSRATALFMASEYRGVSKRKTLQEVRESLPALRQVIHLEDWEEFLLGPASPMALPRVTADAAAMIIYTSGTTGAPKGAVLSHRGIVNMRLAIEPIDLAEGGIWLNWMPMFHTSGSVYTTLGALWKRATQVMVPAVDPGHALKLIDAHRIEFMISVPTIMLGLLGHADFAKYRLESLRVIGTGGSTVPPDLVRRIESSLKVEFVMIYGQTETSISVTQSRRNDSAVRKSETIGRPLPQTEVKIVDPINGSILPRGQIGEICVRACGVMKEYFENPAATSESLRPDGWLHTGDLGSMDEEDYLRLTGRLKDIIIRGGENIFPREIEDALCEHSAVEQAAVFGVPDPQWGEQPVAAVILRPGRSADASLLEGYLKAHLSRNKVPRKWQFVDRFPLTASGKVQKFLLREEFINKAGDASPVDATRKGTSNVVQRS